LVALAGAGLHPGTAKVYSPKIGEKLWLADIVGICRRHVLPKWKAARRKGETPPLYATANFNPHPSGTIETTIKFSDERPTDETAVAITLDLRLLWSIVEETATD
jgi:hypothetical protein